jgi:hypothetical protein
VIACPSCKRRLFSRLDMLHAALQGAARCPGCDRPARLDMLSRWLMASFIALVLPSIFLYAGVFYSGHLFVILIGTVLGGWALLSVVAHPFLTLESSATAPPTERSHSILLLVVLLLAATILDGFIASRFEPEDGPEYPRHAIQRER